MKQKNNEIMPPNKKTAFDGETRQCQIKAAEIL